VYFGGSKKNEEKKNTNTTLSFTKLRNISTLSWEKQEFKRGAIIY